MVIKPSEKFIFESIKPLCNIIFDVGCRTDTHYAEQAETSIIHMFEPNPFFYNECAEKIAKLDTTNTIYLHNFGLGAKTGKYEYWEETQTFFKRTIDFQYKTNKKLSLPIKRFSEYLEEENMKWISFLKIDTEGYEPEILLDGADFIRKNVMCVQFEAANTWKDKGDKTTLKDIYDSFPEFNFGFLYDIANPLASVNEEILTGFTSQESIIIQNDYINRGWGLDIVMWRKK